MEWMEDFDNEELSDYDREEQLREAVQEYNDEHNANYSADTQLKNYRSWKREKYKPDM
jgi:hypothetical protein